MHTARNRQLGGGHVPRFLPALVFGMVTVIAATAAAQSSRPAPDESPQVAQSAQGHAPASGLAADFPDRELVVGTKEASPFSMKQPDGSWTGISIELWRQIAQELGLKFRLVEEPSVQSLLEATARGDYDLSVAAITITPERERSVDFSQPFYNTGLGIAVSLNRMSIWREIIRTMTSLGFLQAAGALIGISFLVGALIWLFERRHNEEFGGSAAKGLGASIWWSAEVMTQASTGHRGPRTLAGRALAIIWMVVSIITIAIFTASVTSALTTRQIRGVVSSVDDLPGVRVGALAGSATLDFLVRERIGYRNFDRVEDGLNMLSSGSIDAFVYDKPLLAWLVAQKFSNSVGVLDVTFEPQSYGIAMPTGSRYRNATDVALLEAIRSEKWKQTLFSYLGEKR
ncbi:MULTISPECIES: transporter substrate-binding domain-containing protein [unclassified Sinorhizobium]|uniref:transporter substrate-binding domain-containing protein n=1 Tax=unclassified Sinorhizobium TaxID=2613772 RepID=UPI0024C25F19|nr:MULTISPECIES: transporter substrate-binding domain-containing protein [unclassified Sinorhizobium]MDK1373299.1 transporter substrate-binding domain-containing protein [Sinorhizobium sp. 6-70]MDK1481789.1 transporter substrate-binding domain-containing protein [Sinorhizobium sp. 6-117]